MQINDTRSHFIKSVVLTAAIATTGFMGLTGCEDDNLATQSTSNSAAPANTPANTGATNAADSTNDGGDSLDINIQGSDGDISYESDNDGSSTSIDIDAN